jgi:hypothetical protein
MRLIVLTAALLSPLSSVTLGVHSTAPRIAQVRVGVRNHYKVGHWTPVRIIVEQNGSLKAARVEVAVSDSDGVMTTSSAPVELPNAPASSATARVHAMVGRLGDSIRIALIDGSGTRVDERTFRPGPLSVKNGAGMVELAATSELIVSLGSKPFGLAEAIPDRDAESGVPGRRTVHLDRIEELPTEWFGYSAVDLLVISPADGELIRELAADTARHAALVRWVELGGRLVILCGGEGSQVILREGGPLARLVPGKVNEIIRLSETGSLEQFAEPAGPIGGRGRGPAIMVPQLTEVDGRIEAHAGRRAADLPLVVRSARGLGEVTFAAVDLTQPPLANWSGRGALLQALVRPYVSEKALDDSTRTLVTRGYDDLSGALRQQLGRSFAAVSFISFSVVAVLAIAYLLVLGPGDYLLVHRWLHRPWMAWITFPVIVLVVGLGAMALAKWRTGPPRPRLNRLELIDVDTIGGQARGTYWAALYSPQTKQFDLSLEPRPPGQVQETATSALLSWWGLPGAGIGGMHATGSDFIIIQEAYRQTEELSRLNGVPALTSSTKSLMGRWTSAVGPLLDTRLADDDGLVSGTIVNGTGQLLRNVRVLYGGWGYRLGDLKPGGQIVIADNLSPHRVKTIVTSAAVGSSAASPAEATQMLTAERASPLGLLNLMMFYDAAGGATFAGLPNRYQAYCDLSRHLELGRAILVADLDGSGSQLIDSSSGKPLGGAGDFGAIVVRFVLSVTKNEIEP